MRGRSRDKFTEDKREKVSSNTLDLGQSVREIMGLSDGNGREDVNGYPDNGAVEDAPFVDVPEPVRKRPRRSVTYTAISYFFVVIFLALIGYTVYFNVQLRGDILRSPYNKRKDALTAYVKRGDIRSADGVLLATSENTEDGGEVRVYPEGRAYAHVVGYDTHGKSGIETIANYQLLESHTAWTDRLLRDFTGQKNDGDTVITTIDASLQRAAYEALGDRRGAIVAIDPKTGDIKAMVSKPDFDPNAIADGWEEIVGEEGSSVLVNRATQGRYAPGSTFKIVTGLSYARAHEGNYDGFHYLCTGELTDGGHTLHCQNNRAHGEEDFQLALSYSCNCAFATMGLEIGADALRDTASDLLFNKKLPSAGLESNPSSFTLDRTSGRALVMQTSFGQGDTLVSPYHMALICASIANDGVLMRPNLIDGVVSADGIDVSDKSARTYRRLMEADEASKLKNMMIKTVADGYYPDVEYTDYTMGGKTGSADYVTSDGEESTHAWFVGFAEKDGKSLAYAVLVEDGVSGTKVAVPVAKSILDVYYR